MDKNREQQPINLIKWINRYPGWWHLICTPNDEHINPQIMITLIEQLAKENFHEIIAVLMTVHRSEEFVKSALEGLFLDLLFSEIRNGKRDEVISKLVRHLE